MQQKPWFKKKYFMAANLRFFFSSVSTEDLKQNDEEPVKILRKKWLYSDKIKWHNICVVPDPTECCALCTIRKSSS